MPWLLDTNGWILFLKPHQLGGRAIAKRLARCAEEEILLCSVVKAELWHGAEKYENRTARLAKLGEVFARYRSMTPPRVTTPTSGTSLRLKAKSSAPTTCKSPPSASLTT